MTKTPITVTVITQADTDVIAAQARRLTPDLTDYYPRAFERWPVDPAVFAPQTPIDCRELARRQRGE